MFCLAVFLFILSSLPFNHFLELISIDNATIPTIRIKENIDVLKYDKLVKNASGSIELNFLLNNLANVNNDAIIKAELKINGIDTTTEIIDFDKVPSRGLKIFIIKKTIIKNNSISFQINFSKLDYAKPGEYNLCLTLNNDLKVCKSSFVFTLPIVSKFLKPKLGLEGDPIRMTCLFESYPNESEIIWSLIKGTNFTTANKIIIIPNDHIEIRPGKETNRTNDTLVISKLFKNDSGIYMCTVISKLGSDFALVKVNVKDRWAALYPFIGIVIEVIILVVAILAYEKYQIRSQNRKNKEYDDNADEDNKEPAIPLSVGGGDEDNVGGENGGPTMEVEGEKVNSVDIRQREATTKNV